jgi:hypothetical protein
MILGGENCGWVLVVRKYGAEWQTEEEEKNGPNLHLENSRERIKRENMTEAVQHIVSLHQIVVVRHVRGSRILGLQVASSSPWSSFLCLSF